MIQFHCIHCGKKIKCDDKHGGKKSKCPFCIGYIDVPMPSEFSSDIQDLTVEENYGGIEKIFCSTCGSSMPKQSLICIKCGSKNATLKEEKEDRYYRSREDAPVATWVIVIAYLLAFFMPIMGFILGIVLLCRKETGHGIGALILSLFSFVCWACIYV